MKKKRYTEEQIINVLRQVDAGRSVEEVCREYGVSQGSFYAWKKKFGSMEVSDAKRLRELEDENRRLKRLVADQALDLHLLKALNAKKW